MAAESDIRFAEFFRRAVGLTPFDFQARFAHDLPPLVNIPTGLGKTAMAVVGWLSRRFGTDDEIRSRTPRRLVYCLPMRVLVEQTRDNAVRWLHNLNRLGQATTFDPPLSGGQPATPKHRVVTYEPNADEFGKVPVYVLMGGEDEDDWDEHPEREAIIIGTQDMLLSRALNRGYAAGRSRWPMQFGLLNTDCLWVFDEIQLMGNGLATTAQLQALRSLFAGVSERRCSGCMSVWMSATLRPEWLKTVDFKDRIDQQGRIDGKTTLSLSHTDHQNDQVAVRWNAKKPLLQAKSKFDESSSLVAEVQQAHRPGTLTIVVVNTVKRACELYQAFPKRQEPDSGLGGRKKKVGRPGAAASESSGDQPTVVLLHSRFRPPDRAARIAEALADVDPSGPGTIIVSTQVVEAGVDVSATTLFTELAPWASLVQRFGRCNRRGEVNDEARVYWIDVLDNNAAPYDAEDLKTAREILEAIVRKPDGEQNVNLAALSELDVKLPFNHLHVIRRRDLIDLFDTTPGLAGKDIDIDRFVREMEDSDVRVFWRDYGDRKNGATPNRIGGKAAHADDVRVAMAPQREELCPAPISDFREFAKEHAGDVWRWNFLAEMWEKVDAAGITPGHVYLVHADAGGYSAKRGWDAKSTTSVEPIPPDESAEPLDATEDDRLSRAGVWQTISAHTEEVCRELDNLLNGLPFDHAQRVALRTAARWHDLGKAHEIFRMALPDGIPDELRLWAKAAGQWKRYGRRHFRHELASALAVLQRPHDTLKTLSDEDLNLVAYLVAAHHGKVRLSIRSLPNEPRPPDACGHPAPQRRFARGVWDGDRLPATDLGGGVSTPAVTLSLEPMELGLCEQPPFVGQPSWAERMIQLRDSLGPFRLAYLEAILRAADIRASISAAGAATRAQAGAIPSSASASGKEGADA